jgi:hypothetical protein
MHGGIRTPRERRGCLRTPEHLMLESSQGELVHPRCRATNRCGYCRQLGLLEDLECLQLDAEETGGPSVWVVLTAREFMTTAQLTPHLTKLRKAAGKSWPRIQWCVHREFQKRGALHVNLLVKGVRPGEAADLLAVLCERHCARVDAEPPGQWAEAVDSGLAVARYLTELLSHGLKESQAPPYGWRGHRQSATRGYFWAPMPVVREAARRSLRGKRELWKRKRDLIAEDERVGGLPPEVWEEWFESIYREAREAVALAETTTWRLRSMKLGQA